MDWIWAIKNVKVFFFFFWARGSKSEDAQEILVYAFSYIFHLHDPKNTAFEFPTAYASAKSWESAMGCEKMKHCFLNSKKAAMQVRSMGREKPAACL